MTTKFYVIEEGVFNQAMLGLAIDAPATTTMLMHAMHDPKPKQFFCQSCGRSIYWQDCPTGGWWVHDISFVDDHEAVCGGYGSDDDD